MALATETYVASSYLSLWVPITAIVFSTSVCPNLCHTKNHVLHQCNSDTSKIRSLWLRQIRRLWLGISINRCLRHRINLECLWRHPAVPVCACAWRNLLLFIASLDTDCIKRIRFGQFNSRSGKTCSDRKFSILLHFTHQMTQAWTSP